MVWAQVHRPGYGRSGRPGEACGKEIKEEVRQEEMTSSVPDPIPSIVEPMVPTLVSLFLILNGYLSRSGTAFVQSVFCRMVESGFSQGIERVLLKDFPTSKGLLNQYELTQRCSMVK